LRSSGYVEHRSIAIWQRTLTNFRPPVDRGTMTFRRQFKISLQTEDAAAGNWSDACAYGWIDRLQFSVCSATTGQNVLTLTFWDMEPLASGWGHRAVGLADVSFRESAPSTDLLACALGEAMRQLPDLGMTLVEVQTEPDSPMLASCCQKLGFSLVDCGTQFGKSGNAALHAEQTRDTGGELPT
jgi:hypothetical protein